MLAANASTLLPVVAVLIGGAVVAIDINDGSIVTYVSSPSFSVNKIANGLTQKEFEKLINDDDKPFFDRAVQGRYSPASTIKPAIGLFGIDKDILDWDYTIQDPGFFILPEDGRIYRGWKKVAMVKLISKMQL